MTRILPAFCLLVVASTAFPEPPHPFSVHDMLAMDRISDPQVSPDGKRVAFVVRKTDLEANRGRTDLWLVDADGSLMGVYRKSHIPDGRFFLRRIHPW